MVEVSSVQRRSTLTLTWNLYPRNADITSILCYYQTTNENTWTQVYKLDTLTNNIETNGVFNRRIRHDLNSSSFMLIINKVTVRDKGTLECAFKSEGTKKEIEREIQIGHLPGM